MVVAHNLLAMNQMRQLKIVGGDKKESTQKLSSGYRINSAADDAAGLSISEKMRHQIRGLDRGADNIMEGISYCQVADGALQEMEEMCQRVNELAIQAANGTNSATDRKYLDEEVQQIKNEINRICVTTKYNDSYIFRCNEDMVDEGSMYKLSFSNEPTDIKIYNTSYDEATKTATYGGVVYKETRYSWDEIDPTMYDAVTNQFREGDYDLVAADGTVFRFHCEDGSKPPEVSRDYSMIAKEDGIFINGEKIAWSEVTGGEDGGLENGNVDAVQYSFTYRGVTISFTPDEEDDFRDVVQKLTGTQWRSTYKLPVAEKAVDANFANSSGYIYDNASIEEYLTTGVLDYSYTLHADDTGLWLTHKNSTTPLGAKSWADIGLANWGNLSTDVGESKQYVYEYILDADKNIKISMNFQLLDETSKDSLIDALDNVEIKASNYISVSNQSEVVLNTPAGNGVIGVSVTRDNIRYTLAEQNDLGRDFTVKNDVFGEEQLTYSGGKFEVSYAGTSNNYTYETDAAQTAAVGDAIATKILNELPGYLKVYLERETSGASKPEDINLTSQLGAANITGGGDQTNFTGVVTIDPSSTTLKRTSNDTAHSTTKYAGISMDFSGLGSTYTLADLIGTGFNSTCETCSAHYSIQFTTPTLTSASWSSWTNLEDGKTYRYSKQTSGQNQTLYLDTETFYGNITNGIELTNVLVNLMQEGGLATHYTAYATDTNSAVLYAYDNRASYVDASGNSIAKHATFEPSSYSFDTIVDVSLTLRDTDTSSNDYLTSNFRYDYSAMLAGNISYNATPDSTGAYVFDTATGKYVKYDSTVHNAADRVSVSASFAKDKEFIKNKIFEDIAAASRVALKAADYASARLNADENPNEAMVTEYNVPEQINYSPYWHNTIQEDEEYIRIQCSSNTIDNLMIKKQKVSLGRLGVSNLNLLTQSQATKAIDMVSTAIHKINTIRSRFGAYQNRLEHAYKTNKNTHENTQRAESQIRDTDMAEEMIKNSNLSIIEQAAQALLAQTKQSNSDVLALIG